MATHPVGVSPFPQPPEYARQYTDANVAKKNLLPPPSIPSEFTVFGEEYNFEEVSLFFIHKFQFFFFFCCTLVIIFFFSRDNMDMVWLVITLFFFLFQACLPLLVFLIFLDDLRIIHVKQLLWMQVLKLPVQF